MFEPKYQNASKKSKANMVFPQSKTNKVPFALRKIVQQVRNLFTFQSRNMYHIRKGNFNMKLSPFLFTCTSTLACSLLIGMNKKEMQTPPSSNPEKALLAPARPAPDIIKDTQGAFYAELSAIVWQGKIWGLEFAEKSYVPTNLGTDSITFDEKLYVPDFAWSAGGKLDIGYELPYDAWDVNTRYTYYSDRFTSKKKRFNSVTDPSGIGIIPLWFYPFYDTTISLIQNPARYASAKANWKFHFNSIDLELGRSFFLSQSLPIRTTIGLKGAWMHHHYHANYENGTVIDASLIRTDGIYTLQLVNSRFAYGQHSWGLGPRISFESNWPLGWGFSLIGNGGLSLLYNFFKSTTEFNDTVILTQIIFEDLGDPSDPVVQIPSLHRKERFHEIDPVLEAQMGFEWGTTYRKNRPFAFHVAITYEWQYWWSQNHVRRNYAPRSPGLTSDARGDLQMHGLTATLRFDF